MKKQIKNTKDLEISKEEGFLYSTFFPSLLVAMDTAARGLIILTTLYVLGMVMTSPFLLWQTIFIQSIVIYWIMKPFIGEVF